VAELRVVPVVSADGRRQSRAAAVMSHWSVMVRNTIFASGPHRRARSQAEADEGGGAKVAVDHAGTIDNVAASEDECFAMIRRSSPTRRRQRLPDRAADDDGIAADD
jgi:acetyl-CoA carboxylase carboxyltransferase component